MDSLGTDFDTLLTRGAGCALVAAAGWAAVVLVTVALEARTRGRIRLAAHTGCPPALRLWLLGVFVAVFAGVTPAQASDPGPESGPGLGPGARAGSGPGGGAGSGARSAHPSIGTALDGLPLPDRAVGGPPRPREPRGVLVRPGDSLWRIVRDRLPHDAPDAAVAAAVAALYAHNRNTIGPDPDLVRPGQHLDFPDATTLPEEP